MCLMNCAWFRFQMHCFQKIFDLHSRKLFAVVCANKKSSLSHKLFLYFYPPLVMTVKATMIRDLIQDDIQIPKTSYLENNCVSL